MNATPDQWPDADKEDERDAAQRSETEANPTPPATDATTSEDVQDSPQLPPEGNRGAATE
ncbi:hypothetical protein [Nocardioides daejeonensis]|uniref:hypothetical protein n=1 Tax=Nocardioides daejeonensis TaxID=1046556 RepID=UPI000D750499|nr:hypothetical protein [Nocardioides daejeonensis]